MYMHIIVATCNESDHGSSNFQISNEFNLGHWFALRNVMAFSNLNSDAFEEHKSHGE